jgi:glycerol uptake facilitator-like aquaporin
MTEIRAPEMARPLAAEFLGTAFLLAAVVGSGIMAERLSSGIAALALLANTLPTGAMLFVLILLFGALSGAHFNPAVTLAVLLRREIAPRTALAYVAVQCLGALAGTFAAHAMFAAPVLQVATNARDGTHLWLSEVIATFGLVLTIFGVRRLGLPHIAASVGLYIAAAYWFTASTSFANPAVTLARAFSDSFTGIAPAHLPPFVIAQLVGAALAAGLAGWLYAGRG